MIKKTVLHSFVSLFLSVFFYILLFYFSFIKEWFPNQLLSIALFTFFISFLFETFKKDGLGKFLGYLIFTILLFYFFIPFKISNTIKFIYYLLYFSLLPASIKIWYDKIKKNRYMVLIAYPDFIVSAALIALLLSYLMPVENRNLYLLDNIKRFAIIGMAIYSKMIFKTKTNAVS